MELRKGIAIAFAGICIANTSVNAINLPAVQYKAAQEVTAETFEQKGDRLLIECIYGTVLDSEGNGKEINSANEDYDYISYADLTEAGLVEPNDTVRTILLYDIGNDSPDAIFGRIDYRIDDGNAVLVSVDIDEVHEKIK